MRFKKVISLTLAIMMICTYSFETVSAKDNDKAKDKDENQVQVSSSNAQKDLENNKPNQSDEGESSKSQLVASDKQNEKKEKIETGSTAQTIDADNLIWESPSDNNPFGGALNFSLFTFKDVSNFNESEGPVAVGGNVNIKTGSIAWAQGTGAQGNSIPKFNIGFLLSGNMNTTSMSNVLNGDAVVDEKNTTQQSINNIGMHSFKTVLKRDVQSYFNTAENQLKSYNNKISALPVNGQVEMPKITWMGGTVTFKAINEDLNVFEVDSEVFIEIFSQKRSVKFDVPSTSVVVINVKGDTTGNATIGFCGDPFITNDIPSGLAGRTIWNFGQDVKRINFIGTDAIWGTVFAPYADLIVNQGGCVNGNLIANNMDARGNMGFEVHYYPFKGKIKWPTIEPATAAIEFTKKGDDGKLLQGATFTLRNKLTNTTVETVSDVNGTVKFENLVEGKYELKEKTAPAGYIKSKATSNFTVKKDGKISGSSVQGLIKKFTNKKSTQPNFNFIKKGNDGKLLEGATFELKNTKKGSIPIASISDTDGKVSFTDLKKGTYTLTEKSAPIGYTKSNETVTVKVSNKGIVSFKYKNKKIGIADVMRKFINNKIILNGNIEFIKYADNKKPLAGAEFGLYKDDVLLRNSVLSAQTTGLVKFENIIPGTYTIIEINAPQYYQIANIQGDITVIVKDDGKVEFYNLSNQISKEKAEELFENTKMNVPANISFLKYTNQLITGTDTNKTLSGSVFGLFSNNYVGEYKQANAIKVATSQENGLVNFEQVYAGDYKIVEISTHEWYNKVVTPYEFSVYLDGKTTFVKDNVETFFINQLKNQSASIEFTKYTDNKASTLSGAIFELQQNGIKTKETVSDSNGIVKFENIQPGDYTIVETFAPSFYTKSNAQINFTVNPDGTTTFKDKKDVAEQEFINKIKSDKGSFSFVKLDNKGQPLSGATFALMQGKTEIGTSTSKDDGTVEFTAINPGVYTIYEKNAPAGYIKSEQTTAVQVNPDGTIVFDVNQAQEKFINIKKASFSFIKVDENNNPLAGATFGIYSNNELIGSAVSDLNGMVSFDKLMQAKYTIKEISAPTGYDSSNKVINVEIDAQCEIVKVEHVGLDFIGDLIAFVNIKKSTPITPPVTPPTEEIPDTETPLTPPIIEGIDDEKTPLAPPTKVPQTSDSTPNIMWILVLAAASAAVLLRKKYKKEM